MKKIIAIILFANLLIGGFALADTTIDNFNSYTPGNLDGQGGWTDISQKWQVQNSIVYEGSQAIKLHDDFTVPLSGALANISITPIMDGTLSLYVYNTSKSGDNVRINLLNGSVQIGFVSTAGQICLNSDTDANCADYDTNAWHLVQVQIDATNSQYRLQVDSTGWLAWLSQPIGEVDKLILSGAGDNSGINSYIDYITASAPPPPPPPPPAPPLTATSSMTNILNPVVNSSTGIALVVFNLFWPYVLVISIIAILVKVISKLVDVFRKRKIN